MIFTKLGIRFRTTKFIADRYVASQMYVKRLDNITYIIAAHGLTSLIPSG